MTKSHTLQSPSTSTQLIRRAATQIYRKRSVRRTSTMPLSTVNRYKKRPIGPGDLNIPSFEIPFIDSASATPLDGNEKDPLPLKSGILCHFSTIIYSVISIKQTVRLIFQASCCSKIRYV